LAFVVNLVVVVAASIDSFDARDFAQRIASLLEGVQPEDITIDVVAGSVRIEARIPTPTSDAAERVVYALQPLAESSMYASDALYMNVTSVQQPETSRLEPPLPPPSTPPPTPPSSPSTRSQQTQVASQPSSDVLGIAFKASIVAMLAILTCIVARLLFVLRLRRKGQNIPVVPAFVTGVPVSVNI